MTEVSILKDDLIDWLIFLDLYF